MNKTNRKQKIVVTDYKKCKFIVKTFIVTHRKHISKKVVPISKNIIKEKSKCAICLTERTFIHEIEDKYDLESKVKVYPKIFTVQCIKENGDFLRKM